MNLQPVALRPGQRLQCARCHGMAPSHGDADQRVLADLDAQAGTFYHARCAAETSRTTLPAGSPWPFPDGTVKPRRVKRGPPEGAETAPW